MGLRGLLLSPAMPRGLQGEGGWEGDEAGGGERSQLQEEINFDKFTKQIAQEGLNWTNLPSNLHESG